MSDPVQVAMIGLGFGAEFIPIYQAHPNANVAAVCRRNETELNAVATILDIKMDPEAIKMETYVVTASRRRERVEDAPAAISVISKTEIRRYH